MVIKVSGEVVSFVSIIIAEYRGLFVMASTYQKTTVLATSAYRKLYRRISSSFTNKFILQIRISILFPRAVNIVCSDRIFRNAIIGKSLLPHLQILLCVHQFHFSGGLAHSIIGVYAKSDLICIVPFFCSNQNYPIGTTGTINGSGIGIFKYFNAFNIIGVYRI